MAFTGAATQVHVSNNCVRITGLSLGIGAAGTIGLTENAAAEVAIVAPDWKPYSNARGGANVNLDSSIKITVISADAAGAAVEDVAVTKAGTLQSDFLATLTNKDVAASGALEIYVEFMG